MFAESAQVVLHARSAVAATATSLVADWLCTHVHGMHDKKRLLLKPSIQAAWLYLLADSRCGFWKLVWPLVNGL